MNIKLCAKCKVRMFLVESGVVVIELFEGHRRYWIADLYICPECRFNLLTDFPDKALATDFEPDRIKKIAKIIELASRRGRLYIWKEKV